MQIKLPRAMRARKVKHAHALILISVLDLLQNVMQEANILPLTKYDNENCDMDRKSVEIFEFPACE